MKRQQRVASDIRDYVLEAILDCNDRDNELHGEDQHEVYELGSHAA